MTAQPSLDQIRQGLANEARLLQKRASDGEALLYSEVSASICRLSALAIEMPDANAPAFAAELAAAQAQATGAAAPAAAAAAQGAPVGAAPAPGFLKRTLANIEAELSDLSAKI
jgi:hypothetical protein